MKQRAFTLIELIVVMAVSAILLTLITIPVVQSFNLTRAAETFAAAQRTGRNLVSSLEREISEAALVRPNHGGSGAIVGWFPDRDNNPVAVRLEYAKLDIFPPAKGDPSSRGAAGGFINPDTGKEDPTLRSAIGDVNLPVAPGNVMVRYWIGLRDPFRDYSNPYLPLKRPGAPSPADPVMAWNTNFGTENLYVLYRAEVPVYVWDRTQGRMVPNAEFFEVVDGRPVLDDPSFFVWRVGDGIAKDQRIRRWQRSARVISDSNRLDMIRPDYNLTTRTVSFDGTAPRILPLVRFQPRRMSAEPAQAGGSLAAGQETDNAAKVGNETFTTEMGAWTLQGVTIWPSAHAGAFGPGESSPGRLRQALQVSERLLVRNSAGLSLVGDQGGVETGLFNITDYVIARDQRTGTGAPFPFTQAAGGAAALSPSRTAPWNELFVPVVPNEKAGSLTASFDIREVGNNADTNARALPFEQRLPASAANLASNQPGIHTGPDTPYAVDISQQDWPGFSWDDAQDANVGINRRFNKLWDAIPAAFPGIAGARDQFAKRFIYLGDTFQPGGEPSPLDRRAVASGGSGWLRPQIVPGSEVVTGPDQRPGPGYGQLVRYTRTTQRPVGVNQYFINYVDQKQPDWSLLGVTGANYGLTSFDPANIFSAVVQTQYRAGYIELNSRLGEPIPEGNIFVSYRFQFTEPNDIVAVDYDSSKQIEIALTIQSYANTAIPNPQQVTVKGTATVRNFLR